MWASLSGLRFAVAKTRGPPAFRSRLGETRPRGLRLCHGLPTVILIRPKVSWWCDRDLQSHKWQGQETLPQLETANRPAATIAAPIINSSNDAGSGTTENWPLKLTTAFARLGFRKAARRVGLASEVGQWRPANECRSINESTTIKNLELRGRHDHSHWPTRYRSLASATLRNPWRIPTDYSWPADSLLERGAS